MDQVPYRRRPRKIGAAATAVSDVATAVSAAPIFRGLLGYGFTGINSKTGNLVSGMDDVFQHVS